MILWQIAAYHMEACGGEEADDGKAKGVDGRQLVGIAVDKQGRLRRGTRPPLIELTVAETARLSMEGSEHVGGVGVGGSALQGDQFGVLCPGLGVKPAPSA